MDYVDPGASFYEIRYRARVIDNLHRRARTFGFALQPIEPTPRAFPEKTESKRISLRQRIRFKNPTGTEASMGWESHIRRICVIA
jgi:hypothetical protein